MICAWIDTSSEAVGSSSTTKSGSQRQRPRDADALTLAAGQLVRIARRHCRRQADLRPAARRSRSGVTRSGPAPETVRPAPRPWCSADRARNRGPGTPSPCAGAARRRSPRRQCRQVGAVEAARVPEVGSISRSTRRASVDLPQPLSPTTPMTAPRGMSSVTSRTASHGARLAEQAAAAGRSAASGRGSRQQHLSHRTAPPSGKMAGHRPPPVRGCGRAGTVRQDVLAARAARMKAAARGIGGRPTGTVPGMPVRLPCAVSVARDAADQRGGIGMRRLRRRAAPTAACFGQPPGIEHRHLVADLRHHAHVMGDRAAAPGRARAPARRGDG